MQENDYETFEREIWKHSIKIHDKTAKPSKPIHTDYTRASEAGDLALEALFRYGVLFLDIVSCKSAKTTFKKDMSYCFKIEDSSGQILSSQRGRVVTGFGSGSLAAMSLNISSSTFPRTFVVKACVYELVLVIIPSYPKYDNSSFQTSILAETLKKQPEVVKLVFNDGEQLFTWCRNALIGNFPFFKSLFNFRDCDKNQTEEHSIELQTDVAVFDAFYQYAFTGKLPLLAELKNPAALYDFARFIMFPELQKTVGLMTINEGSRSDILAFYNKCLLELSSDEDEFAEELSIMALEKLRRQQQ